MSSVAVGAHRRAREERENLTSEEEVNPNEPDSIKKLGVQPCLVIKAMFLVILILGVVVTGVATVAKAVQPPPPPGSGTTVPAIKPKPAAWSSKAITLADGTWHVQAIFKPSGGQLCWQGAIDALADGSLGPYLDRLLAGSPHAGAAFYWETPPLTAALAAKTMFEFVTKAAPSLEGITPDSGPFLVPLASQCTAGGSPVATFPNLGGDAQLVVPCAVAGVPEASYAHIAAFTRGVPAEQRHALWRQVGAALKETVDKRGAAPTWVSTAGGGVNWLHVRLDSSPKYYSHSPYTRPPGGGAARARGRANEGLWRPDPGDS